MRESVLAIQDLASAVRQLAEAFSCADKSKMAPESPRLLTVAEAAERLGCTRDTLYRAIRDGSLTAQRIGQGRGSLRLSLADLESYQRPTAAASKLISASAWEHLPRAAARFR